MTNYYNCITMKVVINLRNKNMRSVLNISLPPQTATTIKKRVKEKGFSNVSEYIRLLIELDNELISKEELLAMAKMADKEYKTGKMKKLKSLKDLV